LVVEKKATRRSVAAEALRHASRKDTQLKQQKTPVQRQSDAGVETSPAPVDQTSEGLISQMGTPIDLPSLIFDIEWYRTRYEDVAQAGIDPVRHFLEDGFREGRDPNPHFQTNWYLASNPDVVASRVNPFLHYLLYGAREGRRPRP